MGVVIGDMGVTAGAGGFCDCCGATGEGGATTGALEDGAGAGTTTGALEDGVGTTTGLLEGAGLAIFPS